MSAQCKRLDKFIEDAEPLLDYVRAEIERNKRRSQLYEKITEQLAGAVVLGTLAVIGAWVFDKLKLDFGIVK
jgi:hypothetical protein